MHRVALRGNAGAGRRLPDGTIDGSREALARKLGAPCVKVFAARRA